MSNPLAVYLHDHLGGARLAIELLRAMQNHHKDEHIKNMAATLLSTIEPDRDLLQQINDAIGGGSNVLKEVTGWVGEKVSSVKLGHGSGDDFSTFQALEFLSLGILGKRALWNALNVVAASDPRLQKYDFGQLTKSAEDQFAIVENERIKLAKIALSSANQT